jgi:hypothetical protein
MARFAVALLLLLLCSASQAYAAVYDWDGGTGDLPFLVWDGHDGDDDAIFLAPHTNASAPSSDQWSVLLNSTATSIVDLAFKLEETDLFTRLGALLSDMLSVGGNSTASVAPHNATTHGDEEGQWAMVSVVALMPLRCADVDRAVAAFNAALQAANPEAKNVSSVARRLGGQACTTGGVCPCHRDARHARTLEIRSTGEGRARSSSPPDHRLLPFPLVRWWQETPSAGAPIPS